MKRIVASLGLVAVGASSLQAANAPGLTRAETSKAWSISAALRGFYDDNYTTSPSRLEADSFGIEVTPTISYNRPMEQSYFGASYTYEMEWYASRDDDQIDHQHEFIATFDHKFDQRYNVSITDSLLYTKEPTVLDGDVSPDPLRTDSEALQNRARIRFRAELSENFGLEPFYRNTFTMYDDDGPGSRSALLDRVEHLIGLNGRYRVRPDLVGLLGYNFGITDYFGDDVIGTDGQGNDFTSDSRDSTTHYLYVGAEHNLTHTLKANVQLGAQYTSYTNTDNDDSLSPYLDGSLEYTYLPGSSVSVGLRHTRNATDVGVTGGELTLDQESTVAYAAVEHRITPRLTGSALGQFQHSTFNGGASDGNVDNLFLVGLSGRYRINPNWSAEAGYNWTRLDSDEVDRSFSRNRIYMGVRATY